MSDDEQVYVTDSGEEIISRSTFLGLNRNFSIDGRELSESVNMTDEDFPALATRGKRKILKVEYQQIGNLMPELDSRMQNAVTMDGNTAFLTAKGTLYFGQSAPRQGLPIAQTLTKFNRSLYLMPSGVIVECPPDSNGRSILGSVTYTHILEIYGRSPTTQEENIIKADTHVTTYVDPQTGEDTGITNYAAKALAHPTVSYAYIGDDGQPVDSQSASATNSLIKIAIPASATIVFEPREITTDVKENDLLHIKATTGDSNSSTVLFEGDYIAEFVIGNNIYIGSSDTITSGTTLYTLTIERKMPKLDVCFEHGGRLWGARYGENADGDFVNEIYCTALNNFVNWFRYGGTAADAWTCSITTEGTWTGGCTLDGYPTFFKETGYYRIFGSTPDTFQLHTKACEGIEKGSEASAVVIAGSLFYKSTNGIMKLTDALPERISGALGFDSYHNAIGGTDGIRYYVRMTDANNEDEERIYVFDTDTGLWHTQSMPYAGEGYNPSIRCFLRLGSSIYSVSDVSKYTMEEIIEDDADLKTLKNEIDTLEMKVSKGKASIIEKLKLAADKANFYIGAALAAQLSDHYCDVELLSVNDQGDSFLRMPTYLKNGDLPGFITYNEEPEVPFEAVTADIGYSTPLRKNINRMYVRALLGRYARLDVEIQYDHEDEWRHVETLHGQGKVKFCNITVRPVRCDSFRLRYSGFGDVKITETDIVYQPGSEYR